MSTISSGIMHQAVVITPYPCERQCYAKLKDFILHVC